MKNLKCLSASAVLICVLGLSAFAGDVQTPPCAPGDVQTPPCSVAQLTPDDSTAPGQTSTPPVSNAADMYSVAEVALSLLQSGLLLY
jgi:hypothetical protein